MEYSFKDRPDKERIQSTIDLYSSGDSKNSELFLEFQWTYRNAQEAYDEILHEYSLSESRFIILMFLKHARNHELSPSEIANKLGSTRATASKLIKGMIGAKFITKRESLTDKRSTIVGLSKQGEIVLEKFLPRNFEAMNLFMTNFSDEEKKQFSYLLQKLQNNTMKLRKK